MKSILSIAGSDSSGGAGIQADIKTITAYGFYAMTAITALTAQNTVGVTQILDVPSSFLQAQLDAVFLDIFPDAVKIGMVSKGALIRTISSALKEYQPHSIVIDPVMVSTSGSLLLDPDAKEALETQLLPLADLITPNIPEAEILAGLTIITQGDMESAAKILYDKYDANILIKGGHQINTANDFLYTGSKKDQQFWFFGERIQNENTHGTGCTLSSAIACGLASGETVSQSIQLAKKFICESLKTDLNLGKGNGPLNHCFNIPGIEKLKELLNSD